MKTRKPKLPTLPEGVRLRWQKLTLEFRDVEDLLTKVAELQEQLGRMAASCFPKLKAMAEPPEGVTSWSITEGRSHSRSIGISRSKAFQTAGGQNRGASMASSVSEAEENGHGFN